MTKSKSFIKVVQEIVKSNNQGDCTSYYVILDNDRVINISKEEAVIICKKFTEFLGNC